MQPSIASLVSFRLHHISSYRPDHYLNFNIDFTSPKLVHIDEKERKQDGLDSIQAQFSPYTVDLTRPKLVRIVARPSSPFVIDLTN